VPIGEKMGCCGTERRGSTSNLGSFGKEPLKIQIPSSKFQRNSKQRGRFIVAVAARPRLPVYGLLVSQKRMVLA
jgi:hypothetical protein